MKADSVTQPGNVLVMAPAMSDGKTNACYDLLTGDDPGSTDLLRVVYHRTPERLIEEWNQTVGTPPASTTIVSVDDRVQTDTLTEELTVDTDSTVTVLSANPNDLTGLGMELNNALSALPESGTENRTCVCFDSVTALLQFVGVENAYKFLHMFTGQLHKIDAIAHFHIDPGAHDTQTISRLKTTFDDMIELNE